MVWLLKMETWVCKWICLCLVSVSVCPEFRKFVQPGAVPLKTPLTHPYSVYWWPDYETYREDPSSDLLSGLLLSPDTSLALLHSLPLNNRNIHFNSNYSGDCCHYLRALHVSVAVPDTSWTLFPLTFTSPLGDTSVLLETDSERFVTWQSNWIPVQICLFSITVMGC